MAISNPKFECVIDIGGLLISTVFGMVKSSMDAHVLHEHGYSLCPTMFILSLRCLTIDVDKGLC